MSPKNEFDQQEATPTLGVQNPAGTVWQDEKTTLIEEGEAEATVWLRNAEGEIFEITVFPCTMGRGNSSDFQIKDTNLSREHARILPYGGGFVIEDLSSLNGTFVNDHRVDRIILADQDLIKIGDQQFEFYLNDPIATGAATAGTRSGTKKKKTAAKKTGTAKTAARALNKPLLIAIAIGCALMITASYLYSVKGKLSRAVVTTTTPTATPMPPTEPAPPEPQPSPEPAPEPAPPIPVAPNLLPPNPLPPNPPEPAPQPVAAPKPEPKPKIVESTAKPIAEPAPMPVTPPPPKVIAEPAPLPVAPPPTKKPAATVTNAADKPTAKTKPPAPTKQSSVKQPTAPKPSGNTRHSSDPERENQAKQAYQAAYRLESIDIQAASAQWQKVLTLVPPSNPYYQKAYQKLKWYGQETR